MGYVSELLGLPHILVLGTRQGEPGQRLNNDVTLNLPGALSSLLTPQSLDAHTLS